MPFLPEGRSVTPFTTVPVPCAFEQLKTPGMDAYTVGGLVMITAETLPQAWPVAREGAWPRRLAGALLVAALIGVALFDRPEPMSPSAAAPRRACQNTNHAPCP
jgi:hypothetical protein